MIHDNGGASAMLEHSTTTDLREPRPRALKFSGGTDVEATGDAAGTWLPRDAT